MAGQQAASPPIPLLNPCFARLCAGSVAYSLGRRHPHAAASPLIDFDLALVLAPLLLLGVSFGVLLNIALPS